MDLFELSATLGLDTKAFMSGLDLAGQAFGAFADAVIGFSKDVLETGMGFDRAMSSVQAVLGQQEGTVENMNRLRDYALNQAKDSIFTAEETANAYYYMGMAGWKSEQMMAGLPGIMALAAASGEDLAMVSDIVTDSITAFGLTADDVSGYVDILAATVTNSNTDISQLGQAFKYAAPLAGTFKLDVDDVALSLGLMASAGIKGSQAGTTLRSVFQRLAADTNDARSTLEGLGVEVFDSTGTMRDWGDIITDARAAFANLNDEEKSNLAYTIAGKTGMSGFLAVMNAGEEDVQKLTKALQEADGAAQAMADTRLDNLWGDVQMFNSSLDVLKQAIYDDVKDPLRDVVKEGTDGLDRIRDAIGEDGIIGGLKQLSTELRNIKDSETFKEFASSAGEALGEIVTLLPEFGIDFAGAAFSLGSSFADGLLNGIGNNLTQKGGILGYLGRSITQTTGIAEHWVNTDMSHGAGSWSGAGNIFGDGVTIPVNIDPNIDIDAIQAALDEAHANGKTTVKIDGIDEVSSDYTAAEIAEMIAAAGATGGEAMATNVTNAAQQSISDVQSGYTNALNNAGNDGGSLLTNAISSIVNLFAPDIRDDLGDMLGDAGWDAGNDIVSDIQSALKFARFTVSVVGVVSSIVNTVKNVFSHNASAMSSGRIYTKPTVFGYYDNAYQVAGDAGPEAVVGTNSLQRMIANAVSASMAGQELVVPRDQGRDITVILEVDRQQFGKAVYRANNEESQRVGVRMSKGGAY